MKENFEFIRSALLDVEENSDGIHFYDISRAMIAKNYNKEEAYAQLLHMSKQELFSGLNYYLDYGLQVQNLSEKGFFLLNKIRDEKDLAKYINKLSKNKTGQTLENLFIVICKGIGAGIASYKNTRDEK